VRGRIIGVDVEEIMEMDHLVGHCEGFSLFSVEWRAIERLENTHGMILISNGKKGVSRNVIIRW
jgi:hypothetical protein